MDRGAHLACRRVPPGGAAARRRVCALLASCVLPLAATLHPVVAAPAATQAPTGSAQARPSLRQDATFTHITIEQGLSDQRVQAIVQDRAGFMWFGTNNGLNRFDGYNIAAYRHDPTNLHSLSGNLIEDLYEDRAGTLWVGTRSGLNAFDRRTERFTQYRHDPADPRSLSDNTVIAIYEDRSGVLWLGTAGGLNRFDRATETFTAYRHDPANPRSLSHNTVRVISKDHSGALWLGTLDGLNRFDRATETFTAYRHDPVNPRSLSHDVVWDIHEDRAGTLWVGTDGGGLNRFDPTTGAFTHYRHDPNNPHSLGNDRVDCLCEDASGALWIGTFGGGLSVLDVTRQTFTTFRHDATISESLSDDYVADITADRAGLIWIGTHGSGVDVYDPPRQAFTLYRHDPKAATSLASDRVWAVYEDQDGVLWIGTLGGGLNRLEPATGHITRYQHDPQNPASLSDDSICTLHMDRSGVLWVGTFGGGLDRFDPARGTFTHYRERDGLSSDRIMSILEDGDAGDPAVGNLWIATGRGLSKLDRDRKTFQTYDTTDGLPLTEYNRGRYKTRSGELLMSSSHGLIAFDPDMVRDDAYVPPVVFTNFLLANKSVPIGEASPLRQAIDQADTIELTYADRVISFEFAALSYRAPRQNRYRYTLEGFDDDWTEVGSTQRLVTYTNLDPGRYIFRVTAANADGVWNEAGRAITLIVTPPWWATWWFRWLVLTLIVGCAFGLYAWRVNSLKGQQRALEAEIGERQQAEDALRASQDSLQRSHAQIQSLAGRLITAQDEERRRIARDLHDVTAQDLGAVAVNLAHLRRVVTDLTPEAQTLVTESVGLADDVLQHIRTLSYLLHPPLLDQLGLAAALRWYIEGFTKRSGIHVDLAIAPEIVRLSPDLETALFRIVQESLTNIHRHSGSASARITLVKQGQRIGLHVKDQGAGMLDEASGAPLDSVQLLGLGILGMHQRLRQFDGTLDIQTDRHGTEIIATVPVGGR